MSMLSLLAWADMAFLTCVVWCAIDGSRMVKIRKEPWRAIGYYIIGVGAFGLLVHSPAGTRSQVFFRVVEDGGVALFSILHLVRRMQEVRRKAAVERGVEFRRNLREHTHG